MRAPDEEPETVAEAPAAAPTAQEQPAAAPAAPAAAADEPESYARIRAFVSGLLEHMGIQAEIEITARENGGVNVNLSGSNRVRSSAAAARDARRDPALTNCAVKPRR